MNQTLRHLLGVIAIAILLASCAPDPRKAAEADRIRTEAQSQAETDELFRAHTDDLHALEVAELEARLQRIEATQEKRIEALNAMWTSVKISGFIAVFVVILALGFSISRASYAIANATAEAAHVKANLIHLDRVTRQYPLLRHVHGDRYALTNPNTGSVYMLDAGREEHRQMISAMGVTQLAGVIGQEARQSSDPAGLAMMSPPIIYGGEG